jgi:type IV pilus assembly protein PilM
MINPFKNLFKQPESSVIGLDIGSSSIKVVQLRKKHGKAVLETYGEIALGPYAGVSVGQATNLPPDKISMALEDLFREANVTTRNCALSIPLRSSLVSLIEMPKVDEKQLQQMIPIEARKYIPVPISEVALDWWVIPKEEDRYLDFVDTEGGKKDKAEKIDVLVVSIHNEILSHYNQIVQASKLNASFFEIEMFSAVRSLIDKNTTPVMIFDMGAAASKMYVVERGVVRTSHIINKGSQDITLSMSQGLGVTVEKAEEIKRSLASQDEASKKSVKEVVSLSLDYIFSESGSVMLNYQKRYNKSISKVYLTGGGCGLFGMLDLAKNAFQTEVEVGEPFAKVEAPVFLQDILKVTGLEFSVAVGIAMRKLQEVA